ncbi:hypothetical protein B0H11DRAFT_2239212 [Mycena galericulata]|nr:hypothetical protein B0H11DRAFT_2239212 [Mycena galericulata]
MPHDLKSLSGADGSRSVSVMVDPTGTGKKFVAAKVTTNGDAAPTNVGTQQIKLSLPAGTQCSGGKAGNLCLLSVKSTSGFGGCTVASQALSASGSSAPDTGSSGTTTTAAPAPAATKSTKPCNSRKRRAVGTRAARALRRSLHENPDGNKLGTAEITEENLCTGWVRAKTPEICSPKTHNERNGTTFVAIEQSIYLGDPFYFQLSEALANQATRASSSPVDPAKKCETDDYSFVEGLTAGCFNLENRIAARTNPIATDAIGNGDTRVVFSVAALEDGWDMAHLNLITCGWNG